MSKNVESRGHPGAGKASTAPPIPIRLKAAAPSLGVPTQADIEQRAAELAQSDGRESFTDADLARAVEELAALGTPPAPPEISPAVEAVTAWDDPPSQAGQRVDPLPMEDEGDISEQLIQDGIEEADHDLRAAAEEADDGGK